MIDWGVPVHLPRHLLSGLLILLAQCWCSTTWLWTAQCLAEVMVLEVWNTCPIKRESLEKSKVSSFLAPFFSRARGCWGGSLLMLELWSYEAMKWRKLWNRGRCCSHPRFEGWVLLQELLVFTFLLYPSGILQFPFPNGYRNILKQLDKVTVGMSSVTVN